MDCITFEYRYPGRYQLKFISPEKVECYSSTDHP